MHRRPQYRMDRYASLMNDFSLDEFSVDLLCVEVSVSLLEAKSRGLIKQIFPS